MLRREEFQGQTPGTVEPVLGLVGPVLIYCDRVRDQPWFAVSVVYIIAYVYICLGRPVPSIHGLFSLVVRASVLRAENLGFDSSIWGGDFSNRVIPVILKIGPPVATLPCAWCYSYRDSAGTDWPSVSILWLDEVESLMCNFYLNVAISKIDGADPSLRYTSIYCWDIKQSTNKQTT